VWLADLDKSLAVVVILRWPANRRTSRLVTVHADTSTVIRRDRYPPQKKISRRYVTKAPCTFGAQALHLTLERVIAMSAIETSIGPPATVVTVSSQPSLVTDLITSNTPNAAPLSGASTPYVSADSTPAIQSNSPVVGGIKTTVGGTGSSVSAGQPTVVFASPA
jgi:hypothetical protein